MFFCLQARVCTLVSADTQTDNHIYLLIHRCWIMTPDRSDHFNTDVSIEEKIILR